MYLKKAGTFIAGASMLVWFLSSYPHSETVAKSYAAKIEQAASPDEASLLSVQADAAQLEQSYLGRIGKALEPLFTPIGLDWKLAVALQTGLAAKEVVVSTLGVLYAVGEGASETDKTLIGAIRNHIPFASAVSFIVVIMLPSLPRGIGCFHARSGRDQIFRLPLDLHDADGLYSGVCSLPPDAASDRGPGGAAALIRSGTVSRKLTQLG